MARPQKQTVDYFPHFASASEGKTMFILQSRFGNDGYACWFKLLEILASSEGHSFNYTKPSDWQFLLAKMGVSADRLAEILGTLADLDAVDRQLYGHKIIWVEKFVDNLSDLYKRRKVDLPRKPVVSADINPVSTDNNGVSTSGKPQSKVKNSIVKNTKSIPIKQKHGEFLNVLLTDDELQKLRDRLNQKTPVLIEKLSTYIESTGRRYKSHYATILSWAQRDEKEAKSGKTRHSRDLPQKYTAPPEYPD